MIRVTHTIYGFDPIQTVSKRDLIEAIVVLNDKIEKLETKVNELETKIKDVDADANELDKDVSPVEEEDVKND